MKTKIVSLIMAFGLFNAAFANSAKIGYASDFFYRGEQKALESVQAAIDLEQDVAGLIASFHACTNQSVDSGVDSYGLSAGLGASVADLIFVHGGFYHFEDLPGQALSEVQVKGSLNVFANPTVSAFRNTSDELYTFEGSLSDSFDVGFANLDLRGSLGNTDVTETNNRTYYSVGGGLSRELGDAVASVSVDLVDSDDIEREFVFATSINFNF